MDKTKMAVTVFNDAAQRYQDKYMDVSGYHDTFVAFCNSIPGNGATILDVACGPGNVTKYLLALRPDFKIHGIDLAPNMITLAKANNPQATFQVMDCRDIKTIGKTYDGIMCGFCLPYISKEEAVQLIKDASAILNPGGVIYISTMEDDYSKSGIETSSSGSQLYMHYHQADYLVEALTVNGLELVQLQRQSYPPAGEAKMTDLIIIAAKL